MLPSTKSFLTAFVLLIAFSRATQQAFCEDRTGRTGIGIQLSTPAPYIDSYSIGTPGSIEMPSDILISMWISDRVALQPSIGTSLNSHETYWRLGISYLNYFSHNKLSPFISVRAKTYLAYSYGTSSVAYLFGLGVGGEYFVGEKFSVGGECQLNYLVQDKGRASLYTDNITYTGVGVFAKFYLN